MTSDMRRFITLLEYNVVNVKEIEEAVNTFLPKIKSKDAKKWFFSAVRKYFINDEKTNTKMNALSARAPEWMKKQHENGQDLHHFSITYESRQKLDHLVDWLNSLYDVSKNKPTKTNAAKNKLIDLAQKYLSGLNAFNMSSLLNDEDSHVDRWFSLVNTVASGKEDVQGLVQIKHYDDGYKWLRLQSKQTLEREGKLMQHCVGSYNQQVANGSTQIYSLRDPNNEPHATIQVQDESIIQVKGKQNRAPSAKYVSYVKDFLATLNITKASSQGTGDLDRMGIKPRHLQSFMNRVTI